MTELLIIELLKELEEVKSSIIYDEDSWKLTLEMENVFC